MSKRVGTLAGEQTLLAEWHALAQLSPQARLHASSTVTAAVFPSWEPLNNAILQPGQSGAAAAATGAELSSLYADAGVSSWALWVPSRALDFDAPDEVDVVDRFTRDETTLVMRADIPRDCPRHDDVVRVSLAALIRFANDEVVPEAELGDPEDAPGLSIWVTVRDGVAVACTNTFLHDGDCGISAVGTLAPWRRRGIARSMLEHALSDAASHGAQTATLQSTPMGQPLYASFGFEPVGRYEEWVWKQPSNPGECR